jgi:anhydro-N-acetylmuramic acid kinase
MRSHIDQLYKMSHQASRTILGLMSGTSLDGLDLALCSIDGHGQGTKLKLLHFITLPYSDAFRLSIRQVFAQPSVPFAQLTVLNVQIAEMHARLVQEALDLWAVPATEIDCIASHGQTVFHAPRALHGRADWPNATFQIGDGDHIARRTGILTISDFRQKHLAAGGEGAPLALYGDYFLFSHEGEERFLLNIGGISNFTYLPADGDTNQAFATDTGPGNTLLDAIAQREFGEMYDKDSRLALNGTVQASLLQTMLEHSYFSDLNKQVQQFRTKTTGPEMFSLAWLDTCLESYPKGKINPFDLMATLTRFSAEAIAQGIRNVPCNSSNKRLFVSGGGAHNTLMISYIRELLPEFQIENIDALGMPGDAKEACLFAVLANETLAGQEAQKILGGVPLVGMGKISFPG